MPFREITTEEKEKIVMEYFAGERITDLSIKYGISRDSIHKWINRVRPAISKALIRKPKSPHRKKKGG